MARTHYANPRADMTLCMRPVADVAVVRDRSQGVDCQRCLKALAQYDAADEFVGSRGITEYVHVIDISGLTLDDMATVVEIVRGIAYPVVDVNHHTLTITYRVGDSDVIADLWDLREEVGEMETQIARYFSSPLHLGKPVEKRTVAA